MRDASFQVRRSAYRAAALWGDDRLESICTTWSQSSDLELRKRAAEAEAWLSIANSDEVVSGFGLAGIQSHRYEGFGRVFCRLDANVVGQKNTLIRFLWPPPVTMKAS